MLRSLLIATALAVACAADGEVQEVNSPFTLHQFRQELIKSDVNLVVFYASWSEAWERFEPKLESIEDAVADVKGLRVITVDTEVHAELSRFSAKSTLTVAFFWGSYPSIPVYFKQRTGLTPKDIMDFASKMMVATDMIAPSMKSIVKRFMEAPFNSAEQNETIAEAKWMRSKIDRYVKMMENLRNDTSSIALTVNNHKREILGKAEKMGLEQLVRKRAELALYEEFAQHLYDADEDTPELATLKLDDPRKRKAKAEVEVEVEVTASDNAALF
jgi:hypothetical protein